MSAAFGPCAAASALALAGALGACATAPKLEERPAVAELAPIELPSFEVGTVYRRVSNIDGTSADWEVIRASEDGGHVGRSADGCTWTRSSGDPHAPADEWSGCGSGEWSSGTDQVSAATGNLWPLVPGNEASWTHTPTSSKRRGTTETLRCRVSGPFAISARVGEVDVMKVTCKGEWDTRVTYWNAEHGDVRAWRVHNEDGLRWDNELIGADAS